MRAVTGVRWALHAGLFVSIAGQIPTVAFSAQNSRPPQPQQQVVVVPIEPLSVSSASARRVERWISVAIGRLPGIVAVRLRSAQRRAARKLWTPLCRRRRDCLRTLARNSGASFVLSGEVGRLGDAFVLYLRAHDANGRRLRAVTGVVDPGAEPLLAAEHLACQLLTPDAYRGRLLVQSDVPGAWIYVDGRRVSRTPMRRPVVVPVGTHTLRVTHTSYRDDVRFVRVDYRAQLVVSAALTPIEVSARRMRLAKRGRILKDSELPWYRQWWAVGTFGVLVATTAAVLAATLPATVRHDVSREIPSSATAP